MPLVNFPSCRQQMYRHCERNLRLLVFLRLKEDWLSEERVSQRGSEKEMLWGQKPFLYFTRRPISMIWNHPLKNVFYFLVMYIISYISASQKTQKKKQRRKQEETRWKRKSCEIIKSKILEISQAKVVPFFEVEFSIW